MELLRIDEPGEAISPTVLLGAKVRELAGIEADSPRILSVYLDLTIRDAPRRERARIDAKTGLARVDRVAEAREAGGIDRGVAKADVEKARERIGSWTAPGAQAPGRGVAMFLSAEDGLDLLVAAPQPFPNDVRASRGAVLVPLVRLMDAGADALLVLVDRDRSRIVHVALGAEVASMHLEYDVAPRHRQGDWGNRTRPRYSGGALNAPGLAAQGPWSRQPTPHYQEHMESEVAEHHRALAEEVMRLYVGIGAPRLVVHGPDGVKEAFERHLPDEVRGRVEHVRGLDPAHPQGDLRQWIARYVAEMRSRDVRDGLGRAHEAALAGGLGAAEPQAVLDALQGRRVMDLYFDARMVAEGRQCSDCGHVQLTGLNCAACGADTGTVDLGEAMVRLALEQDAAVHPVEGDETMRRLQAVARMRF